jgi:predicted dinucleotide-binding enzyme
MKIGIIGAGAIGGTLAGKLAAAGHEVALANSKGPESIRELAQGIGASPVLVEDIAIGADVVIVSIPQGRVGELPKELLSKLADNVVVIDTGNYYPGLRDAAIEEIEAGTPESRWVEQQIGHPVIKVFGNILADCLVNGSRSAGDPQRIALAVAGDDAKAKKVAMELVDQVGFDAVDAGSIEDSWRQQPGSPAYCTNLSASDLRKALEQADRPTLPERRDRAVQQLMQIVQRPEGFTTDDIVAMNRSL